MGYRVHRAVADPSCILWVPAPLAGAYISLWSVVASFGLGLAALNPMWSIGGALATHAVLAVWGAREPHLASLLIAHIATRAPTQSLWPSKGRRFVP